ncbi:MAG: hypothetical protein NZ891_08510 [bacterium]|nr:hypothetical protein [bacterium]MDW8164763.1 glycoside hydrolase family 38 C-terminal domain-containing protein [Candidatus Omnitrophota bacterium]
MVKIFLIPHFHYDTIYQNTYENYLDVSFEIIKKVLEIIRKNKEYKFLIEQTILLEEFWNRCPQYRKEVEDFIKTKRIECAPGFFVMPDMNLISGESLIRQIRRGKKFLKKFKIEPKIAWISDCWGHHRQLPQILKKAGYEAYVFSRGMPRKKKNCFLQFYWEGIDRTKILTYWMASGYFGFFIRDKNKRNEYYFDEIENHLKILKKFKKHELLLLPNGGDFVKPDFKIIEIIKDWNKKKKEKIIFAIPSQYFEQIKKQKLPVLNYDFNPMFNGTYTSRIEIKQSNRKIENEIYLLELFNVFYEIEMKKDNRLIDGKIDEIEYYLLFNQFHDIICGSILDEGYFMCMQYYNIAEKTFIELFNSIIDELTLPMDNSISVFNQCSFSRNDICIFNLDLPTDKEIKIFENGNELKSQILEYKDGKATIGFKIFTLPFERKTLSYKIVGKKDNFKVEVPFEFENKYFRVRISENGLISSLIFKNKQLVDQKRPFWGEIIFQRDMGDFWVYYLSPVLGESRYSETFKDPYPENVQKYKEAIFQHNLTPESIILEKGELGIKLNIEIKILFWKTWWKFVQTCFLYYDFPFIDYKIKFFADGKNYRIRVAFPTTIKKGKIRREIPYGIEKQKEGEYPCQNFIDYFDDEKGVCILNKGTPGSGVVDNVIMLSLFRSVDMGPNKAKSETGFCIGKNFNFEYRVIPFDPKEKDYKPYLLGISFNRPIVLIPGVKWRKEDIFIKIFPEDIPISCFQKLSTRKYLLRIYEPEGKKRIIEIRTRNKFEFSETSIDGFYIYEKIGKGNAVSLTLKPFEIKTLNLSLIE